MRKEIAYVAMDGKRFSALEACMKYEEMFIKLNDTKIIMYNYGEKIPIETLEDVKDNWCKCNLMFINDGAVLTWIENNIGVVSFKPVPPRLSRLLEMGRR